MSLEIWGYIFGGATIFALIVGMFSIWNGRMTRMFLAELIKEQSRLTREMIAKMDERTVKISEQIERIPEKTAILLK